jgi:hypothetical protein
MVRELGKSNLTIDTNRNSVKWRNGFRRGGRAPTTMAQVADTSEDVGIFPGAVTSVRQNVERNLSAILAWTA